MTDADQKLRDDKSRADGYSEWSAKQEVKVLISLLPALETDAHRDIFAALLESAFAAGFHTGERNIATQMMRGMAEHMRASMAEHPRRDR
jgi:hypothetical protein